MIYRYEIKNNGTEDILYLYEKDYRNTVRDYGIDDQELESKFKSKWVYKNSLIRWTFQKLKGIKNRLKAA